MGQLQYRCCIGMHGNTKYSNILKGFTCEDTNRSEQNMHNSMLSKQVEVEANKLQWCTVQYWKKLYLHYSLLLSTVIMKHQGRKSLKYGSTCTVLYRCTACARIALTVLKSSQFWDLILEHRLRENTHTAITHFFFFLLQLFFVIFIAAGMALCMKPTQEVMPCNRSSEL